jgi:NAD(P)H-dependent FMN reductase
MTNPRPLFIPVILGTPRQGRQSENAARLMAEEVAKRDGVETELVDIRELSILTNDAGEAVKHPEFSATVNRADALVIVAPEYNHGYPGLLKQVLDTNLKEYIHKAVGICGVSAGPFGGTRVIQNLLPVMRELGLVTIFWDVNFSSVQNVFGEGGELKDQAFPRRIDKFLKELIWMAKVLRWGRESVTLESQRSNCSVDRGLESRAMTVEKMICEECGVEMNFHAEKIDPLAAVGNPEAIDPDLESAVSEIHSCPECGSSASRRSTS